MSNKKPRQMSNAEIPGVSIRSIQSTKPESTPAHTILSNDYSSTKQLPSNRAKKFSEGIAERKIMDVYLRPSSCLRLTARFQIE
jgi:hypothetical protein